MPIPIVHDHLNHQHYEATLAVTDYHQPFLRRSLCLKSKKRPITNTTPVQPVRPQIQIDDPKVIAAYSNFCRVTGTPEELAIDFGLNPQPFGVPTESIPVTQRIVTNFYTAKRMLQALHLTIQRHEATFGVLETDVQKRVTSRQA